MIAHAGLIAVRLGGAWRGVLIEGPSGSGKSDLALRATQAGFRLVADDRVRLFASAGRLFGTAPAPLAGLLEARGVGVIAQPALRMAEIALIARLVDDPGAPPRLPDPAFETRVGVSLPVLAFWPFAASAPFTLIAALEHLGGQRQQEYEAPLAPSERRGGVKRFCR